MSDVHAKNILLIIDPQNDFHTKDVNNNKATEMPSTPIL